MNYYICLFVGMWYCLPELNTPAYGLVTAEEFFNNPSAYPNMLDGGLRPSDVDITGNLDPNYFGY